MPAMRALQLSYRCRAWPAPTEVKTLNLMAVTLSSRRGSKSSGYSNLILKVIACD